MNSELDSEIGLVTLHLSYASFLLNVAHNMFEKDVYILITTPQTYLKAASYAVCHHEASPGK